MVVAVRIRYFWNKVTFTHTHTHQNTRLPTDFLKGEWRDCRSVFRNFIFGFILSTFVSPIAIEMVHIRTILEDDAQIYTQMEIKLEQGTPYRASEYSNFWEMRPCDDSLIDAYTFDLFSI